MATSIAPRCSSVAVVLLACLTRLAYGGQLGGPADAVLDEPSGMSEAEIVNALDADDCFGDDDCFRTLSLVQLRGGVQMKKDRWGTLSLEAEVSNDVLKHALFSDDDDDSSHGLELVQTGAHVDQHSDKSRRTQVVVNYDGSVVNVHGELGKHEGMMQVEVKADGTVQM